MSTEQSEMEMTQIAVDYEIYQLHFNQSEAEILVGGMTKTIYHIDITFKHI